MKKLISLMLAGLMILWAFPAFAGGSSVSTYKYNLQIVDENDDPVTTGTASVYVKTINTQTNASVWPTDNTTSGTLSGNVTTDEMGEIISFFGVATSYDVQVQYKGKTYLYEDFAPTSDRRIKVQKLQPAIDLATNRLTTPYSVLTIPVAGDFFHVDSSGEAVHEISETGQLAGRRVSLLFNSTSGTFGLKPSSTNIAISSGISGTTAAVGTLTLGSGTVLELIYDGTLWRVIS